MAFHFEDHRNSISRRAGLQTWPANPRETDSEGNTRTFSIASAPISKPSLMFATRMRDTAFKPLIEKHQSVLCEDRLGNRVLHTA